MSGSHILTDRHQKDHRGKDVFFDSVITNQR